MDIIPFFFEKIAQQYPDAIAAIYEDQTITYQELNYKVNQFARYLCDQGVTPNAIVALCLNRSIDLLIVIMGILKAGAAYVPLDPAQPNTRLLFILNDSQSPFLVTNSSCTNKFSGYTGQFFYLDQLKNKIEKQANPNLHLDISGNSLAYIIYTSGSTGVPKGVSIEHQSVVDYCCWFKEYSGVKIHDRIDFSSNYIFDMSITTSIVPLMLGLTITICDDLTKKHLGRYLHYIQSNKVNIIKMTPSYLKILLNEVMNHPIKLSDLHCLILGGENLPSQDCHAWFNIFPSQTIYNEYGPTEATVGVSSYKITHETLDSLGKNVPIGLPSKHVTYYILDSNQQKVAIGERGELHIGGRCLARGYVNRSDLTDEKFIHNPFSQVEGDRIYKTGDFCRELENNVFEYLGRMDHQVKVKGYRVELDEIQHCLSKHPAIKDVLVIAIETTSQDQQLVAYFIPHRVNQVPTTIHFKQFLQDCLPNYMIPSAFVWVDEFPLTDNGKLNRAALPLPDYFSHQAYIAPRTVLEEKITNIWLETFGLKSIGMDDNFFELGGHSLIAARIVSEIEKIIDHELSLNDFYQAPTIALLAKFIENNQIKEKTDTLKSTVVLPQIKSSYIPLNDFQFMFWIADIFEKKIKKLNIFGRRQMIGKIDRVALRVAFDCLLRKNQILCYRTHKMTPFQTPQKNLTLHVQEKDISHLSKEMTERTLLESYEYLIHYGPWLNNVPRLLVRLFFLQDDRFELQICMPHIVSDHLSVDVFFENLSSYYHAYQYQLSIDNFKEDQRVEKYLINQQIRADLKLNKNIEFWKDYLRDASFFTFESSLIIKNMDAEGYEYSTYLELPENAVGRLMHYCAAGRISMTDGLCAALSIALARDFNHDGDISKKLFMSIIRSTRDHPITHNRIGCFLRLDAIKVDIHSTLELKILSKQIHQSIIDTMPYQQCPGMLKLACVNGLGWAHTSAKYYVLRTCIYLYTKLFSSLKLNHRLLSLYIGLMRFWKDDSFYIYVNILTNFIKGSNHQKNTPLFGLETIPTKLTFHDLSRIDHVLEFCFLRDESNNTPYLVISGNLKPFVREKIGKEMIKILLNETKSSIRIEHQRS